MVCFVIALDSISGAVFFGQVSLPSPVAMPVASMNVSHRARPKHDPGIRSTRSCIDIGKTQRSQT
jgi:hypothetical protein